MLICLSNDVSMNPGPNFITSPRMPRTRGFKAAHLNVRSVVSKMDSIRQFLSENIVHIFTVSECWLNSSTADSEISVSGYSVLRNDRTNRGGGEVAVFVRDDIPFKNRTDLTQNTTCESLLLEIDRPKCKKLFISCIYKAVDFAIETLLQHLEHILSNLPHGSDFILLGDFNIDVQNSRRMSLTRQLLNFVNLHSLDQLISEPSRVTEHTSSTNDFLFVNNSHRVVKSDVIPLSISDHFLTIAVKSF